MIHDLKSSVNLQLMVVWRSVIYQIALTFLQQMKVNLVSLGAIFTRKLKQFWCGDT